MREKTRAVIDVCGAEAAITVVGGYWKITILKLLTTRTLRFGELARELPEVTPRMLTRQLRELEQDHLVHREVFPQVPPKVEYSLTEIGRTTAPVIDALEAWVDGYARMATDAEAGRDAMVAAGGPA